MYTMSNTLSKTDKVKDIGVITDDKLNFSDNLAEQFNRKNRIEGIIRRTFVYLDLEMFKTLYKGLFKLHLEYAIQIWCPCLAKDIDIRVIENVQSRATKLVFEIKDLTYEERQMKIGLPTLSYRSRGDMIDTYKVLCRKYDED